MLRIPVGRHSGEKHLALSVTSRPVIMLLSLQTQPGLGIYQEGAWLYFEFPCVSEMLKNGSEDRGISRDT